VLVKQQATTDFQKATGVSSIDKTDAYELLPWATANLMRKFRAGKLTDAEKKAYVKKYQDSSLARDLYENGKYVSKKEKAHLKDTASTYEKMVAPINTGYQTKQKGGVLDWLHEIFFGKTRKDAGFIGSMLGQDSARQMHTGGIVSKTGKIFAEAGEVITPKRLATGGPAGGVDTQRVTKSMSVDFSGLIDKLKDITLKVDEKPLKVDTKEPVKMSVDTNDLPALKVEKPEWKVGVEDTKIPSIQIEKPDWKVGVEVPKDKVTVTIDVNDAASRLSSAISTALEKQVRVQVSGTTNAVGGEKFNQLSEAVSKVKDQLVQVKVNLEDKIKMLGTNNQTSDINRTVTTIMNDKLGSLKQEINDLRTDISRNESDHNRMRTTLDTRLADYEYKLNNVQNFSGSRGL
jgi:hypothetical protein